MEKKVKPTYEEFMNETLNNLHYVKIIDQFINGPKKTIALLHDKLVIDTTNVIRGIETPKDNDPILVILDGLVYSPDPKLKNINDFRVSLLKQLLDKEHNVGGGELMTYSLSYLLDDTRPTTNIKFLDVVMRLACVLSLIEANIISKESFFKKYPVPMSSTINSICSALDIEVPFRLEE